MENFFYWKQKLINIKKLALTEVTTEKLFFKIDVLKGMQNLYNKFL